MALSESSGGLGEKNLLDGVDTTEVRARQKTPKKFRGFLLDLAKGLVACFSSLLIAPGGVLALQGALQGLHSPIRALARAGFVGIIEPAAHRPHRTRALGLLTDQLRASCLGQAMGLQ